MKLLGGLAVAGNILAVMVTLCHTSGVDARSLLIVLKQRRNLPVWRGLPQAL